MGDNNFFSVYKTQIIFGLLTLIAISFALYFTLYQPVKCDTYACFQDKMASCSKATYINEQPEASWGYEITGKENEQCNVNVKLLQAKKGDLEIENYVGHEMSCIYPLGIVTYPEKDLGTCSGRLKEDLQSMVIKKLYTYILDNLGELEEGLNQAI